MHACTVGSAYCVFVTSRSVPLALASANRALHQIDSPSQIGEPSGAGDTVKTGRNASQHQPQVQGDGEAIVGEDQPPERREILEARTGDGFFLV